MESHLDKLLAHLREIGYKPPRGPKRCRLEDLKKHSFSAPDEETDRFVAAIYEDRRRWAEAPARDE
jgi:hypothetical protein